MKAKDPTGLLDNLRLSPTGNVMDDKAFTVLVRYLRALEEKISDLNCRLTAVETFLRQHSDADSEYLLRELEDCANRTRELLKQDSVEQIDALLYSIELGKDPLSSDS